MNPSRLTYLVKSIAAFVIVVILQACDHGTNAPGEVVIAPEKSTGSITLPEPIQSAAIDQTSIRAWIVIDDGENPPLREAMTVVDGVAIFERGGFPVGTYSIAVEFEYTSAEFGEAKLARAEQKDINVGKDAISSIEFSGRDFVYADSDDDGVYDLKELESNTNPNDSTQKPDIVCTQQQGEITCFEDNFTVAGSVSGLFEGEVTLSLNGADPVNVSGGLFLFNTPLRHKDHYTVTAVFGLNPYNQSCELLNSAGEINKANVSNVMFNCTFDHAMLPAENTCGDCHDGNSAGGKNASHITTTNLCNVCHSVDAWKPVIAVDHENVIGVCESCHNATIASGKSDTHMGTSEVCGACHSTTAWQIEDPDAVDHDHTLGVCWDCHNGTVASTKGGSHISSTTTCSACHTTQVWAPVPVVSVDHAHTQGSCVTCHDNLKYPGKPQTHMSTSNGCETCHQSGPAAWKPVVKVDHNEVLGVCSSCHNGVIANGKPAIHIPTTQECNLCHSTTLWLPAAIDHTPFTSSEDCLTCHDSVVASGKSGVHIPSSGLCGACHVVFPGVWTNVPADAVDHAQVIGTCISCHNGTIASGKHTAHIASSNECQACHQPGPVDWNNVSNANVDHSQVQGACDSCHNGSIASGKGVNHINSSGVCNACHSVPPANWLGIVQVDHLQVIGTCVSCHAKSIGHINTTNNCGACHVTPPGQWKPVLVSAVNHAEVLGVCSSCHNNVIAAGKPANHLLTASECSACHLTNAWKPIHHQGFSTDCISCHDGNTAGGKGQSHINSSNLCGNCHVPAPTPWAPLNSIDHAQAIGMCVSCHNGIIATGKGANHINTSNACNACHGTVQWKPVVSVDHTQVIGVCSGCHTKPTGHINSTTTCDACHSTTLWIPVIVVDHAQVVGTCVSCHNSTITIGKSPNHINTTNVCEACHLAPPQALAFAPVPASLVDHAQVIGTCSSCHNNVNVGGKPVGHMPTTLECGSCHSTNAWTPATGG